MVSKSIELPATGAGADPHLPRNGGHGNPYGGDDEARWGYSVMTALKRWAHLDQCTGQPTSTTVTQTETLISYTQCGGGSSVSLYRNTGTGHAWPGVPTGSVPTDTTIHATALIWRFFHAHSR